MDPHSWPHPHQISMRVPILNAVTGLAGIPAGGTALIATTGLPADLTGWTLSVGPLNVPFTGDQNGVLTVNLPLDLGIGAQPVQLTAPGNPPIATVPRVILQLDPPPPVILWAVDYPAPTAPTAPVVPVLVSTSTPALLGAPVTLMVYGLSNPCGVLPSGMASCHEPRTKAASAPSISMRKPENSRCPISCPGLAYALR